MRATLVRVGLGLVGVTLGALAVIGLREATLSTHQPVAPDSRVAITIEVATNRTERSQTPAEMAEALVLFCRLAVNSDLAGGIDEVDEDLFRFVLTPTLDQTNRRQFRGCMEDWTLDGVLVDVLEMEEDVAPSAG